MILDTAGRLAIDDDLMSELEEIKSAVNPIETFLVVDAMTGQDAVRSGSEFNRRIGLSGMLLTKMDGDARGGAALSMKSVTGLPVKFVGVGERPEQFEAFHPERIAQRILGMGDVTTLIEKAQQQIDEDEAKRLEQRLRRNEFDLNDMLEQFRSIRRMGPLSDVLGMIPGLGGLRGSNAMQNVDEKRMSQVEAIILSMTPQERSNPRLLNGSRRRRVANGSGTSPSQVNQLVGAVSPDAEDDEADKRPGRRAGASEHDARDEVRACRRLAGYLRYSRLAVASFWRRVATPFWTPWGWEKMLEPEMKVVAPAFRVGAMVADLMPPSTAISNGWSEWMVCIMERASLILGRVSGRKS